MRVLLLLLVAMPVAIVAGCAGAPARIDATPVVAAERAFAADGARRGWAAAFRSHAAPEAVMLNPDPVNAHESLATVQGDGETTLDWRPAYAGIARSGDFGFTTGPFQIRGREGVIGHYFTVWRRQADGTWKWIFDAGTDVVDKDPVAADIEVPELPVASAGSTSAQAALEEVAALELTHARAGALVELLASDARVNRPFVARGIGRTASAALLAADGTTMFRSLRREASAAGDMVFSMGEARDRHEGADRLRYYARIWQLRPEGWRIVFDEIVPRRT
jgi:ketosteroid isomerase-like protein